jgi:hypothetical protein
VGFSASDSGVGAPPGVSDSGGGRPTFVSDRAVGEPPSRPIGGKGALYDLAISGRSSDGSGLLKANA